MTEFTRDPPIWLPSRQVIAFDVDHDGRKLPCAITKDALERMAGGGRRSSRALYPAFGAARTRILAAVTAKLALTLAAGSAEILLTIADLF